MLDSQNPLSDDPIEPEPEAFLPDPLLDHLRQSEPMAVEAFELYEAGYSLREIAKRQGVKWMTVNARVRHVRQWLDDVLSPADDRQA
jgi:DNA-directed RNA polymerase specialized sigma24 family protein